MKGKWTRPEQQTQSKCGTPKQQGAKTLYSLNFCNAAIVDMATNGWLKTVYKRKKKETKAVKDKIESEKEKKKKVCNHYTLA